MEVKEAFQALGLEEMMKNAQCIPISGLNDLSQLKIIDTGLNRKLKKGEPAKAQAFWEQHLKEHPKDFDGFMGSLAGICKKNGEFILTLRQTRFSHFVATRDQRLGKKIVMKSSYLDSQYPLPLSLGMVTKTMPTRDNPEGCLVAAIRGNTAFDGYRATFPPGGYFDFGKRYHWQHNPENPDQRIIRLEEEVKREADEELPGMPWSHLKVFGIVHSLVDSCQPLIAGMIETPYTPAKIMTEYGSHSNDEMSQVICVPAGIESLRWFAKKYTLCIHDAWKLALYVTNTYEDPQ